MYETSPRSRLSPAETLYRDVQAHRARDEAALAETRRARALAAAPVTRLVLDLIEDSQSQQLELADRMSASLRDALNWTYSREALPDIPSEQERAAAVEALHTLAGLEQERARSARRLAKGYAGINSGLERPLLEASAAHSAANVRLLRSLAKRLARGETSTPQPSTIWDHALRQRKLAAKRDQAEAA